MSIDIKKATQFIFEEVDIVKYTSEVMGFSYKRFGKNLRTVCPLHQDSDPSLTITEGKQLWHCFGCKEGGSLITLVEKFHNINRLQATIKILDDMSIDKSQFQDLLEEDVKSTILLAAQDYFIKKVKKSKVFKDYFLNKGYTNEDLNKIVEVGVGYCDSKDKLSDFLLDKGFSENEIWEYDLQGNRFDGSVVFPVFNKYGNLSYFKCRSFGEVKYYSSVSEIPTYSKKAILGVHRLRSEQYVILVEGDSDWLALYLRGYNALGMGGLKLTEEMLDIIQSFEIKDVYVWTDGDQAGWGFLQKLSKTYGKDFCARNLTGRAIYIDHADPDESVLSGMNVGGAMDIAEIVPIYILEQKHNNKDISGDYRKSYDLIDSAIRMIDGYDQMTIEYFIQYLYHRTGFDVEAIRDRFIKYLNVDLYDYKAEQHLIASLLDNHEYIAHYNITERWFVSNAAKLIFRLIKKEQANSINIATLVPMWAGSYLEQLPIVDENSIKEYIKVIKSLYQRRMVADIAKGVLNKNTDFDESLNYLNESIIKLYKDNQDSTSNLLQSAKEIVDRMINKTPIESMKLGEAWTMTDRMLHGIRPKKLIMLFGNTGHGKTNIALNWVYWLSVRQNYKGLIFSGEMDDYELTERLLAIATGISATKINTNNVGDQDMDRIFEAVKKIKGDTLYIHNTMDFDHIFNVIKYMVIKYGIQYVLFDYLQLLSPSHSMKGMNRTQQLKEFTRKMKVDICDELGQAVILLGQLGDQGLDDTIPQTRRSSESKLILADADVTAAIRRKNRKEQELRPNGNIIYHIDKVRYNSSDIVLNLDMNEISLFIKETPYNKGDYDA